MLKHFLFCGIIYADADGLHEQLERAIPQGPAIYAFMQAEEWLYIGSAAKGARSRLSSYLRKQRARIDNPKHRDIGEYLTKGPIEFWVLPVRDRVRIIDDVPVDWLLGAESGLIKTLHPLINRRERVSP